tara:strand:+ start:1884 stop:2165 length:282 start_codon:yes stop_codon:yes gene_type:complete
MKMSDHFEQDLKACDITNGLGDTKFGLVDSYGIATGKMQMEAAAHAINQHDALVAMNAELVEALELVLVITETEEATKYMIEMTLRKAKELSQ